MAGSSIKFSFVGDTKDFQQSLSRAEQAVEDVGDTARRSMAEVDDAVGGAADGVASASSQAAGGIGDIAGALEATGLISEGMAQSMETGAAAIMGLTGAADIANLVTEKLRLTTIGQTIAEKARLITGKAVAAATKVWTGIQWAFNAAMSANPIGIVIIAIIALIAAIVIAYKKSETFRAIVDAVFKALGTAVQFVWDKIRPFFAWLGGIFVQVWKGIQAAWKNPSAFFKGLGKRITGGIGNLKNTLLQKGKDVLGGLLKGIKFLWDHSLVGYVVNRRKAIVNAIGNVGSLLLNKGKDILRGLKNGIAFIWVNVVRPYLRLGSKIRSAVGNLGSVLYNAGVAVLRGLRDGLSYAWNNYVAPYLNKVTNLIPDWKGPLSKDLVLLYENGRAIMEGLNSGIADGFDRDVTRTLRGITGEIAGTEFTVGNPSLGASTGGIVVNVQAGVGDPVAIGRQVASVLGSYVANGGRVRVA